MKEGGGEMSWSETQFRGGESVVIVSADLCQNQKGIKTILIKGRGKGLYKTSDGTKEERTCFGSTRNIGTGAVPDSASKESVGK